VVFFEKETASYHALGQKWHYRRVVSRRVSRWTVAYSSRGGYLVVCLVRRWSRWEV